MFHPGTQRLMEVWADLPDAGRVPGRSSLDPVALGTLLPQAFMADRADGAPLLRFAGGWVERLHGNSLAGADWLGLWQAESRALVAAAVVQTCRESRPVVIVGEGDPGAGLLEVVLVPLRSAGGAADRLLGLYQPTGFGGLAMRDAPPLTARVSIGVGEPRRAPLQLAAVNGRRVA